MVRKQPDANVIVSVPKNGEGQVKILDDDNSQKIDTPLFFTSVEKETGSIYGHRINTATLSCDSIWTIELGA